MSRRLDIELTSNRQDGTWTWRAAGAKSPKGVVNGSLLSANAKTGDVLKVEADFDIDGISVLSVVNMREKGQRGNLLEMLASEKTFTPVTQKLADKPKSDRKGGRDAKGKRDGDSRPARPPRDPNAPRRAASTRPDGTTGRPTRPSRPHFTAPPEMPKRPTAKRLKPKHVHRTAVLETLPVEQRGVAERALEGGIKAVRDAVKIQNDQLRKDGKPEVPSDGLISMAQNLLPKLRVADWLDKAEAAKSDLSTLDLRDLRSVVVASEDPMVMRDETTRALAAELKTALKERQDAAQTLWLSDIVDALKVGRTVRALKMTSEPPKAGQPFPSELGAKLAQAATAGLTTETAPDRWIALLEALAFSPIRGQVKLTTMPQQPSEALLATVKRLSPLLPQIAALFGVEVSPGVTAPRPLRPTRPVRVKPKTAAAPSAAKTTAAVEPAASEPVVIEPAATEPVAAEPVASDSAPTSAE
ncbi:unannotated protein [freshwater metagenome]|uniref:Unannotated protein n=1 Tax=freshwater metagenome TaxID=449393 RepID=A0A6J7KVC4_9ZZZZ|nr:hypothetical protein [Actinomycetota bacterium]MSW48766.1 hypothetical protein [Actinomycetota bacterium]